MSKFLTFAIRHSHPLAFVQLFDDFAIHQLTERESYKDSLIYFICKVKKVRFDLRTLRIENDRIKVNLIHNGIPYETDFCVFNGLVPTLLESSTSKKLEFNAEGIAHPISYTPDLILRRLNIKCP